jgi:hypothetical protein
VLALGRELEMASKALWQKEAEAQRAVEQLRVQVAALQEQVYLHVCVCVCVYLCVCASVYTCLHAHTHACMHTRAHAGYCHTPLTT